MELSVSAVRQALPCLCQWETSESVPFSRGCDRRKPAMQTDYGNWIPEWLEYAAFAGAVLALVLAMVFFSCGAVGWKAAGVVFAVFFICGAKWGIWLVKAHRA